MQHKTNNIRNSRWRARHKRHNTYLTYRAVSRSFIHRFATLDDLHELNILIKRKKRTLLQEGRTSATLVKESPLDVHRVMTNSKIRPSARYLWKSLESLPNKTKLPICRLIKRPDNSYTRIKNDIRNLEAHNCLARAIDGRCNPVWILKGRVTKRDERKYKHA